MPLPAPGRARFPMLFLLLIAAATLLPALDVNRSMMQYAHRIWGQEEGLFQPTIYSILQTRDGFLWLGTQDSLIRFDGVHFREFADGSSVLHGSTVRTLLEDKQGNLWAATLGSGIVRIAADGSVKQYSTHNGLPSDTVFCLAQSGGALWGCTTEGLVRIADDRTQTLAKADGLPSNRIRAACATPDGTLWVAGLDFGLVHMLGKRFVSVPAALPGGTTAAVLACDADGSLWAGTAAGLVHRQGARSRLYSTRDGLPDNDVSSLSISPDNTVWIGTNDGVSRLRNDEISVFRARDGLSHSQVLSLCSDREGALWAGTKNGLDQFTDGKVVPYSTTEGLLSNNVGPVLEDDAGRLWIGTLDKGLNWFDGRHFHALTAHDGLLSNQILSLALDPAGDLWVGTARGVNRVHNQRIAASYGPDRGLAEPGDDIRSLFVDEHRTLWAGSGAGLRYLPAGADRFRAMQPAGSSEPAAVLAMAAGRVVSLFAGVEGPALYLFENGTLSTRTLDTTHPVDCFFHDAARHTLWMGTLGSGLLRWKNDALARVYVRDGLYDNRIYSILRDAHGDLWFASSKGIFRVNDQDLEDLADGKRKSIRSLPFSTGQLRFECRSGVQPAATRTRDGRLWFSTTTGLVVLDPLHLFGNQVPPPARITALLANGKRVGGEPDLKPGDADNLEIRYAGLSFISPEKVTFRYRLEGYDRAWVEAGERRVAFYTNLPPHRFRFLLEARSADGVWSKTPAALRFTVLPRLYQRVWFWPLVALLAALLVVLVVRIRVRRLRRRFALVMAERSRIARDLHDTLLQGLSGITMQLQALWTRLPASSEKRLLGDIIADAGKCSSEARQSLWGLRSPAASGPPFSQKLADLARQATSGKPIALSLAIEPLSLADLPDAEYQLLRIAQESVANALKHAGASRLLVSLQVANNQLRMSIEDDGIGMAGQFLQTPGHFGLDAIRERAAEIDAQVAFESTPDTGTRVAVNLDLSRKASAGSNQRASEIHQL